MAIQESAGFDALLAELEQLEHEEIELSSLRRKLHDRIDGGFANEVTVRREREISGERLAMHRRIAAVRLQLAEMGERATR
jgi:hypothetical protein